MHLAQTLRRALYVAVRRRRAAAPRRSGVGVIEHVINETGGATPSNSTPVDLVSYP
jgi:hypothetical protein